MWEVEKVGTWVCIKIHSEETGKCGVGEVRTRGHDNRCRLYPIFMFVIDQLVTRGTRAENVFKCKLLKIFSRILVLVN